MDAKNFAAEEFKSLREEIRSRQMRAFWTVVIGLLGVPALTYVAGTANMQLWLALPFFVLVIIVLFLSEQNAMMRAGRYIREILEAHTGFTPGWEAWLESGREHRLMEKHFFACFISVFFLYYFASIAMAMSRLWVMAMGEETGGYWTWFYGAAGAYAVATLWGLATLMQHWKSSTSTTN